MFGHLSAQGILRDAAGQVNQPMISPSIFSIQYCRVADLSPKKVYLRKKKALTLRNYVLFLFLFIFPFLFVNNSESCAFETFMNDRE